MPRYRFAKQRDDFVPFLHITFSAIEIDALRNLLAENLDPNFRAIIPSKHLSLLKEMYEDLKRPEGPPISYDRKQDKPE